ncbi:hypothetical protein [Haloarcula sp. H-GB5]
MSDESESAGEGSTDDRTESPSGDDETDLPPGLPYPVAYRNTVWTMPSNQMVIRRYTGFKWFKKTAEEGELYFGPAASYADDDPNEGQVTDEVRSREQTQSAGDQVTLQDGSEMNISKGMERFRQNTQSQYFLSCWRLGTDENRDHWEKFGSDNLTVAIETTVGQIWNHLQSEREVHMGMVRYIDRQQDTIPNAPPETYFFKGLDYSWEKEFRLALIGGGNPIMDIRDDPDEEFQLPDYQEQEFASFDQDAVINRVLIEPEATDEDLQRVEEILSENSIQAEVEHSRLDSDSQQCPSRFVYGNANLQTSEEELNRRLKQEIESTDWSTYDTVDWIQILPLWAADRAEIVGSHFEVYQYRPEETPPEPEEYGHSRLKQFRRVSRFNDGEHIQTWDIDPQDESSSGD